MTREDIIRMAREAGCDPHDMTCDFSVNLEDLERLAALVAAAEREACADQLSPSLREGALLSDAELKEAAQKIAEVLKADVQLDEALAEKSEEYELIGQIFGTYGGRWVFILHNKHLAWPGGTAVYVRRRKKCDWSNFWDMRRAAEVHPRPQIQRVGVKK
jgi:hypothetical protein